MFRRSARAVAVLITFVVLLAGNGFAAEIEMRNGTVYSGVTIIRQDVIAVECYSKFGKLTLPTTEIAQIDGVPMAQIPVNTLPFGSLPTAPAATPQPRARSTPYTVATPTPPPRKSSNAATIPPAQITPRPPPKAAPSAPPRAATPSPASPTPTPAASPGAFSTLLDPSEWQLSWQDFAVPLFFAAWIVSILRVRRDGRRSPDGHSRRWLIVAVVLPILGYLT